MVFFCIALGVLGVIAVLVTVVGGLTTVMKVYGVVLAILFVCTTIIVSIRIIVTKKNRSDDDEK